jgi:MtrB/PioB family decaheme-associated outer membrane protein
MEARTVNHHQDLFSRKALYLAVASVFLLPSAAFAQAGQVSAEVEVGVGHVSRDSFKFGEYTGLKDKGGYFIGNFELSGSNPETSKYWSFTGTNLGLKSRNLRYDFRNQGNFRIGLEYDEIPKFRSESTQTIFNGVGGNTLTLPAGWAHIAGTTSTTTPAVTAQINSNLRRYDDKHQRKNYKMEFSKVLSSEWDARVNFRHETKEGVKVVGAVMGSSGGNPKSVLIPEPVDYETNMVEASVNYSTSKMQFQLGYNLSLFSNKNDFLRWQSPLSHTGWATGSMGTPPFQGQIGLPPDNQFHQIVASGGYNISPTARLNGTFQYGRMTQDQAFLPYTINPGLLIPLPLPRTSLDGRIDNTLLNLAFTARPLPRLNVAASYRYDDRNNKTPQAFYAHVPGDSQLQQAALTSSLWRANLPISYRQNQVKLDARYALVNRLTLNAGYDYEETKRTYSEVDKTREHTYRIGLRRSFSEAINGAISYSHSDRKNTGYDGTVPYYADHTPEYVANLLLNPATAFENHPFLRKFNYADRERDKVRLSINATPHHMVSLQFRADVNQDEYKNTRFGLTDSRTHSYTLDGSVTPRQNLTFYAFYTYETASNDTAGRSFSSANKAAQATPLTSPNDWYNTSKDRFDVIGLGFKLTDLGRLDIGGDYTYSHGVGKIDTTVGSALAASAPMPDLVSRLHQFQIYGKYKVQKNATIKLSYWHQKLKTSDWSMDNVTPTTLANVLTTGQLSPNYSVNVVGVSLIYRFQ